MQLLKFQYLEPKCQPTWTMGLSEQMGIDAAVTWLGTQEWATEMLVLLVTI